MGIFALGGQWKQGNELEGYVIGRDKKEYDV